MTGIKLPMIDRLRRIVLLRYMFASVGALAVDMGSFLALLELGVVPVIASATGYSLGIVAHWLLSSRAVFSDSVAEKGVARTRQKALFVGSAVAGLVLTTLIVGTGTALGIDSRASKVIAIGVSFTATWFLRKRIVFQ
jgi:putative flippase GtrA